jgi:glutamate synthase domain-containing protein 3
VLRYVTVGEQVAMVETTIPLTVNLVSADEAAAAEADHELTEEVVILKAARAQTQAREHADRGEFEIARKLLSEAAEDLRASAAGSAQADELLATAEMLGENFAMMAPATYDPSTRKRMHYQSRTTSERRKKREP